MARVPQPAAGTMRLEDMEKMAVLRALEETGGNKSEAARILGITRRALYNKIEKFGI
jgi:two-component system response regulator HydG